jgi:hypothetical protein
MADYRFYLVRHCNAIRTNMRGRWYMLLMTDLLQNCNLPPLVKHGRSFVVVKLGCCPSSLWQNNRAFSHSLALSHPDVTIEALSHCPYPHTSGLPPTTGVDSDSSRHHPGPQGEIPWHRSSARCPAPPPRDCPAARHRHAGGSYHLIWLIWPLQSLVASSVSVVMLFGIEQAIAFYYKISVARDALLMVHCVCCNLTRDGERSGDSVIELSRRGGSSIRIDLNNFWWSENTINTYKYTKDLKPKDASKDISEFAEAKNTLV